MGMSECGRRKELVKKVAVERRKPLSAMKGIKSG